MDSPEEEFYRPRTPLRFGSVPTALPVDPREYNVRGREDSVSGASVSSFNDIFPAILSQESYLDGFDGESGSDFSPSPPPHQSCFSGHEGGISPHTRSIGTPSIASLQDERLCQCNDRRFPSTSFKTEGEPKDHTCDHAYSSSSSSLANTPTDEEFIPFYFLPALCIEDEPAPAKSRVSPSELTTTSWRTRRKQQQDQQRSSQASAISLSVKKRKIIPPPSATIHTLMSPPPTHLSNPPHRRVPKTERTRPPTTLLQRQLHYPTSQCNCVQCQRRAPPTYLPPTQYAATTPHQPSPPQPAPPPTTNFQAPLWQTLTAATAAGTGLQGLPTTQYEWQQQLPHMQQQPPASPQVGQQGVDVWGFLPSSNATYGVY